MERLKSLNYCSLFLWIFICFLLDDFCCFNDEYFLLFGNLEGCSDERFGILEKCWRILEVLFGFIMYFVGSILLNVSWRICCGSLNYILCIFDDWEFSIVTHLIILLNYTNFCHSNIFFKTHLNNSFQKSNKLLHHISHLLISSQ